MNFNEELFARVARLEEAMEHLKEESISADRLRAELLQAKLEGIKEGRDFAFKAIGSIIGGLTLIAAILGLWLKYA